METSAVSQFPDAVNAWLFQAWGLHKRRGWAFYRAYDHVLVRYLAAGNPWPFLDLILRLRRTPGPKAAKFIAAITDGQTMLDGAGELSGIPVTVRGRFRQCKPLYQIRISERRGRGRPKADDTIKSRIRARLVVGFIALANGRSPPSAFWIDLGKALFPDQYVRWKGQPFPFKAKLLRTDGGLGRPRDPELQARDEVLAMVVNAKIAGGLKYDAAIEEVRAEIEEQCKAGRALGSVAIGLVERATIRAAYDKWSRQRET